MIIKRFLALLQAAPERGFYANAHFGESDHSAETPTAVRRGRRFT